MTQYDIAVLQKVYYVRTAAFAIYHANKLHLKRLIYSLKLSFYVDMDHQFLLLKKNTSVVRPTFAPHKFKIVCCFLAFAIWI